MTELILIHRPRNGNPLEETLQPVVEVGASSLGAPIWSTCLRQIGFVHSRDFQQISSQIRAADEVYQGEAAFGFILEVVCGLKSPLLGETEVQGQFKLFVASVAEKFPEMWGAYSSFFQGVLSESKRVRTLHLKNLGSQSYGSLIRRRLGQETVAILGAGQLTQQILPWLKQAQKIQIHARSTEKAKALSAGYSQVEVRQWLQSPEAGLLVVAAPISNQELMSALENRMAEKVIDLRGEQRLDADHLQALGLGHGSYESLQELMSEMNQDQQRIGEKVDDARRSICRCGESFMNRAISRPGGWEDLCG